MKKLDIIQNLIKFHIKNVATMYVDSSKSHGKYTRSLLRENYRECGKVKHRTIANLSHCSVEEIDAIKLVACQS